ncbi:hypothetical protein J6590_052939 [Homalodisca vitripennis]|nr:hypothetical protein J6590_052939 [Homalodisca vitripennis]
MDGQSSRTLTKNDCVVAQVLVAARTSYRRVGRRLYVTASKQGTTTAVAALFCRQPPYLLVCVVQLPFPTAVYSHGYTVEGTVTAVAALFCRQPPYLLVCVVQLPFPTAVYSPLLHCRGNSYSGRPLFTYWYVWCNSPFPQPCTVTVTL